MSWDYWDLKIYGLIVFVIIFALMVAAVWLGTILLQEAESIKAASKNVQSAFAFVELEVNKKLSNNNAIHFFDLMRIVEMAAKRMPFVKVSVEKAFERNQVSIIIESDGIKARYTFLATIVEYPNKAAITKSAATGS
uniref:I-spanin n=1 Tax=Pantoea phage Survivor TaxID=3232176 RepID=A0AAU8KXZ0_9CAUD